MISMESDLSWISSIAIRDINFVVMLEAKPLPEWAHFVRFEVYLIKC